MPTIDAFQTDSPSENGQASENVRKTESQDRLAGELWIRGDAKTEHAGRGKGVELGTEGTATPRRELA